MTDPSELDPVADADTDREVYIGDGVYASWDGLMFILRTRRDEGEHWIALEPGVLRSLNRFAEGSYAALVARPGATS